jgi:hypothetical protein
MESSQDSLMKSCRWLKVRTSVVYASEPTFGNQNTDLYFPVRDEYLALEYQVI